MPEPTGYIPDKNASEWWNNAKKKVYDYGKFAEENYSPITKFLVPVDNLDNLVNSMNTQNNNPSFKGALEVMSQGLQTTPAFTSSIKHGWGAFKTSVVSKLFQRGAYESTDEKKYGGPLPQTLQVPNDNSLNVPYKPENAMRIDMIKNSGWEYNQPPSRRDNMLQQNSPQPFNPSWPFGEPGESSIPTSIKPYSHTKAEAKRSEIGVYLQKQKDLLDSKKQEIIGNMKKRVSR